MDDPCRLWADIPVEILGLFVGLLYFTDRDSFAAVCRPWRKAAARDPSPPVPFLALPIDDTAPQSLSLASPAEGGQIHHLKIPIATGANYFGSSRGWLFIHSPPVGHHLLNPFTREELQLPPTISDTMLSAVSMYSITGNPQPFVAAALSSNPTGNGDCMVTALGKSGLVALCKLGDRVWSLLPGFYACDIAFHGGLLYCIGEEGNLTVLELFPNTKLKVRCSPTAVGIGLDFVSGWKSTYLMPRGEELLMVAVHIEMPTTWEARIFRPLVFRLNPALTEWIPLEDLEGWTLFLGRGCSAAFKPSTYLYFMPNCIFFFDRRGCLVFNHEDGSTNKFSPDHPFDYSYATKCKHFWLLHKAEP